MLTLFQIGAMHAPIPTKDVGYKGWLEYIGNFEIKKLHEFPLCQYEVEITSEPNKGLHTKIGFEEL